MKSIAQPCAGVNASADAHPQTDASTDHPSGFVSDALRAANERLMALRAQQTGQGEALSAVQEHAAAALAALPLHLGWESARFSSVLRTHSRSAGSGLAAGGAPEDNALRIVIKQSTHKTPTPNLKPTVKAYPTILNAILKQEQAAAGRVWLLCRYLDSDGRGWLPVEALRHALTRRKAEGGRWKAENSSCILHPSSFPVLGWRRLRQILGQGKGIFWERDDAGRLWVFGAARVAATLGVARLQNRPILLPIAELTGTMGQVRALFYAAFHAGRPEGQPISRATITAVTGVPARTQFHYEETARIRRQRNFTIGAGWGRASAENDAYQHGNAVFQFIDYRGRHGKCGQTYAARQLPNSYTSTLQACTRGRQRKVNARLADLVTWGAGERPKTVFTRRFWRSGKAAIRACAEADDRRMLLIRTVTAHPTSFKLWHSRE